MTQKKIVILFAVSIAIGIFLTACAGVATGKFEPGNRVFTTGPFIQAWQAPMIDVAFTVSHGPVAMHKSMEAYRAAQVIEQIQSYGHLCNRP